MQEGSRAMTFGTPSPVASGQPYQVLRVSDHAPSTLTGFADAEDFTIDMVGHAYRVRGAGRLADEGVRFHEKDLDHDGKDIRVWRVTRGKDGCFYAQHDAAF